MKDGVGIQRGARKGHGPMIGARPWDHLPDTTTEAVKRERENERTARANNPYHRALEALSATTTKRFGRT